MEMENTRNSEDIVWSIWWHIVNIMIDKLYLLAATIMKNGKVQSGSALQNEIGFETAVKLFRPNGIHYERRFGVGFKVTDRDLIAIGNTETEAELDNLVFIMNRIASSGETNIDFINTGSLSVEDMSAKAEHFMDMLNTHSETPSYIRDSDDALKTRVFSGIYNITRSSQNQLKAQITVDTCTGELKDRAAKTTAGNAEKEVTPYDPSSKYVMQVQNMLGKAVVGIGAVSLKTYFILSTSYNRKCERVVNAIKAEDYATSRQLMESMIITRPSVDGDVQTTLANINLTKIIRELNRKLNLYNKQLELGDNADIQEKKNSVIFQLNTFKTLQANTSKISTPEFLSGIISLAADNAKDLALPKLNATEDLVDIYTTAAMIGIPFQETADIMTSEMFGWMTRAGANNIFDETTQGSKVKNMVKFALLEKIDIRAVKIILSSYNNYLKYSGKAKTKAYQFASYKNKEACIASLNNPNIIDGIVEAFRDTNEYKVEEETPIYKKDSEGKEVYDTDGKLVYETYEENGETKIKTEKKTIIKRGIIGDAPSYISANMQEDMEMMDEEEKQHISDPWTQKDFYKAYKLFEKYQERLKYTQDPENIKKLELLNTLLTYVEEMSTLGRQASINQGLKTDIRAFYNSLRTVEDLINKRLKEAKLLKIDKQGNVVSGEKFDFKQFLQDDKYAKFWIDAMNSNTPMSVLKCFNILEALADSPNFIAMSKIQPYADIIMKNVLTTYDTATKIADSLIDRGIVYSLSDNDFKAVTDYITDLNIFTFLKNSGIALDLDTIAGMTGSCVTLYETKGTTRRTAVKQLELNTAQNIASFKHLMEENIIPALKAKFNGNRFLDALARRDNAKLGSETYALPLQMMEIDSDEGMMEQYAGYLQDFNNIAKEPYAGMTIGDWFFLYNLIVNKNGFGQQSLTRIFEDLVDSVNCPKVIQMYYESVGKAPIVDLIEAQECISKNSRGTKVPNPDSIKRIELPSDFTLYLPVTCNLNAETIISNSSNQYTWKPLKNVDPIEALDTLAQTLNNKKLNLVKVITDEEAKDMGITEGSYGFIKDGKVYLNSSRFTDDQTGCGSALGIGMHEIAHLVIAGIKAMDNSRPEKQAYYKLLSQVRNEADYNEIAALYPDSVGSDLDEEVLCNKIQSLLTNRINKSSEVEVGFVDDGILLGGLQQIFENIKLKDVIDNNLEYAIENFTFGLFDSLDQIKEEYTLNSQQMAAIKSVLYNSSDENNNLKQDC